MTSRERISGVDTALLRIDNPTNLMMIVGVMTFREKLELAAVRRIIADRFLAFRRFRSRPVQAAAGAWWEADESFDLAWHVRRHPKRGRLGKAALEDLVSDLASTALDPARPLWQFHLVDYGTGSALITRIHHCYADGIALIQVMLSMTHATAAGSLAVQPARKRASRPAETDFWEQVLAPVTGALSGAARVGKGLLGGKGIDFASELARVLLMGKDAETRFRGSLGSRKRVAWATPLPLDQVKV